MCCINFRSYTILWKDIFLIQYIFHFFMSFNYDTTFTCKLHTSEWFYLVKLFYLVFKYLRYYLKHQTLILQMLFYIWADSKVQTCPFMKFYLWYLMIFCVFSKRVLTLNNVLNCCRLQWHTIIVMWVVLGVSWSLYIQKPLNTVLYLSVS